MEHLPSKNNQIGNSSLHSSIAKVSPANRLTGIRQCTTSYMASILASLKEFGKKVEDRCLPPPLEELVADEEKRSPALKTLLDTTKTKLKLYNCKMVIMVLVCALVVIYTIIYDVQHPLVSDNVEVLDEFVVPNVVIQCPSLCM